MITLEMLPLHVSGVRLDDVRRWIDHAWVRPDGGPDAWLFQPIDVARIRLIVELRDELSVNEEALPAVLLLLDQVYAARRQMRAICEALESAPDAREAVREALAGF